MFIFTTKDYDKGIYKVLCLAEVISQNDNLSNMWVKANIIENNKYKVTITTKLKY